MWEVSLRSIMVNSEVNSEVNYGETHGNLMETSWKPHKLSKTSHKNQSNGRVKPVNLNKPVYNQSGT